MATTDVSHDGAQQFDFMREQIATRRCSRLTVKNQLPIGCQARR
jgi:hypothetical protein